MSDEASVPETGDGLGLEARWALVAPHRDRLLVIAQRRCPTAEDAEDCVHEAMVRAVAYPALDPGRVGPLLSTLVLRVAVDHARKRSRELRGRHRLVTVASQSQQAPDEAVADHDEAVWLAAQLTRLPERERQVFARRAAGLSVGETATTLELTYKSVESAFTRARGRLRLWATGTALALGALLRRQRSRPALAAALVASVASVACLVGPSPFGRSHGTDHDGPPAVAGQHPGIEDLRAHLASVSVGAAPFRDAGGSSGQRPATASAGAHGGGGGGGTQHPKPDFTITTGPVQAGPPSGPGSGGVLQVTIAGYTTPGPPGKGTTDCLTYGLQHTEVGCPHP